MAASISFQHRDCRTSVAPELWRPRVDGSDLVVFMDRRGATFASVVETGTSYLWLCGSPYDTLPDSFANDAKKHGAKIVTRDKRGFFDVVLQDGDHIRISDASEWFGKNLDAEACRVGWVELLALLSEHTRSEDDRWLMPRPTPAMTGRAFFQTYMPQTMAFQRLSPDHRKIIMASDDNSTFGGSQSRREVGFQPARSIPAFYNFDHRRFYQRVALSLSMPEGDIIETIGGEFRPFKPAWYQIEGRVPDDWPHVGLVQVDGNWLREPGRIFSGWFAEPEAALLCVPEARGVALDASSPIASSWRPVIKRMLTLSLSAGADRPGFKKVIEKLLSIEDAGNCPAISTACRNILLQGIGSLHSTRGIEQEIHEEDFYLEDHREPDKRFFRREDKPEIIVVRRKGSVVTDAPQVAAHLWSSARARMTRAMLSIPFDDIVGVYLDAISTTRVHSFPSHTNEPAFRLKGMLNTPCPTPKTISDLELLSEKAASHLHALAET